MPSSRTKGTSKTILIALMLRFVIISFEPAVNVWLFLAGRQGLEPR